MTHYTKTKGAFITFLVVLCFLLLCLGGKAQTRCKAIKKDGTQCKMVTTNANGYCNFHQSDKYTKSESKKIPVLKSANPYLLKVGERENTFDLYDDSRYVGTFESKELDEIVLKDNL